MTSPHSLHLFSFSLSAIMSQSENRFLSKPRTVSVIACPFRWLFLFWLIYVSSIRIHSVLIYCCTWFCSSVVDRYGNEQRIISSLYYPSHIIVLYVAQGRCKLWSYPARRRRSCWWHKGVCFFGLVTLLAGHRMLCRVRPSLIFSFVIKGLGYDVNFPGHDQFDITAIPDDKPIGRLLNPRIVYVYTLLWNCPLDLASLLINYTIFCL